MKTQDSKILLEKIGRLNDKLERKDREIKEIRQRARFWEKLFEGIHEKIMIIDTNFVIQDVNNMFLEYSGLKRESVVGKKCFEISYRSKRPCALGMELCPLEKAKKTGQRVEITDFCKTEEGKSEELIRIIYPLITGGVPPEYFAELSRDVTDYRNMATRLKGSEQKFKTILATATDAILSIDEEDRIVLFNDAAEQIFGYSRDEVLGKSFNMLIPPKHRDQSKYVKQFLEKKRLSVLGKKLSLTAIRRDGQEFPITLSLSYHKMRGNITFTAIIRDVSTEKRLEKELLQSERLAAVGQTVSHVAHEFRNPLMIIGGLSRQIKDGITNDKAAQKLEIIIDEISRIEKLVENLGDFTKEYKLVKRPVDVNSLLKDILKIMREMYHPDRCLFQVDLAKELKKTRCDPDKLKQVFMNVIANGVESMEDGGTIRVGIRKWAAGVEIQLSDEGTGIGEEDLLHIFEPFYTTRQKGSGLGLSISYKIIKAHNGEIWAESRPGKGTTFFIRLPDG